MFLSRSVSNAITFASSSSRTVMRTAKRGAGAAATRSYTTGPDALFNPTDEHKMLRQSVRAFAEKEVEPQALEYNRKEIFNMDLYKQCGELGLLGITVPEEYGGSGMDATAATLVHEELSAVDPAFCLSYLAHSMLFVNNLAQNGNEEQKHKYLPDACSGATIGGMGMSEPGAGTDVLGLKTTATETADGWTLNGSKMWITNGAINDEELGDVFLIYAKTGAGKGDISLFLVEKGMKGFSLGQRIKDKLGMRASGTAEIVFEDVKIPKENLVGDLNGAVICMMRNLEIERLTLAGMSIGIARRCVEVMSKYGQERLCFGKPINSFGQIQRFIADSYAEYMAGKCYTYHIANNLKLDAAGQRIDSDGVKLYCSTMGKNVADRAIQCLGGNGYTGEYVVERLWRDAKLLEIGGGTLEAHQKNMTRDLTSVDNL